MSDPYTDEAPETGSILSDDSDYYKHVEHGSLNHPSLTRYYDGPPTSPLTTSKIMYSHPGTNSGQSSINVTSDAVRFLLGGSTNSFPEHPHDYTEESDDEQQNDVALSSSRLSPLRYYSTNLSLTSPRSARDQPSHSPTSSLHDGESSFYFYMRSKDSPNQNVVSSPSPSRRETSFHRSPAEEFDTSTFSPSGKLINGDQARLTIPEALKGNNIGTWDGQPAQVTESVYRTYREETVEEENEEDGELEDEDSMSQTPSRIISSRVHSRTEVRTEIVEEISYTPLSDRSIPSRQNTSFKALSPINRQPATQGSPFNLHVPSPPKLRAQPDSPFLEDNKNEDGAANHELDISGDGEDEIGKKNRHRYESLKEVRPHNRPVRPRNYKKDSWSLKRTPFSNEEISEEDEDRFSDMQGYTNQRGAEPRKSDRTDRVMRTHEDRNKYKRDDEVYNDSRLDNFSNLNLKQSDRDSKMRQFEQNMLSRLTEEIFSDEPTSKRSPENPNTKHNDFVSSDEKEFLDDTGSQEKIFDTKTMDNEFLPSQISDEAMYQDYVRQQQESSRSWTNTDPITVSRPRTLYGSDDDRLVGAPINTEAGIPGFPSDFDEGRASPDWPHDFADDEDFAKMADDDKRPGMVESFEDQLSLHNNFPRLSPLRIRPQSPDWPREGFRAELSHNMTNLPVSPLPQHRRSSSKPDDFSHESPRMSKIFDQPVTPTPYRRPLDEDLSPKTFSSLPRTPKTVDHLPTSVSTRRAADRIPLSDPFQRSPPQEWLLHEPQLPQNSHTRRVDKQPGPAPFLYGQPRNDNLLFREQKSNLSAQPTSRQRVFPHQLLDPDVRDAATKNNISPRRQHERKDREPIESSPSEQEQRKERLSNLEKEQFLRRYELLQKRIQAQEEEYEEAWKDMAAKYDDMQKALDARVKALEARLESTNYELEKSRHENEVLKENYRDTKYQGHAADNLPSSKQLPRDKSRSTREMIRQDKLNFKLQLWKADEMSLEELRALTKEIMIKLEVDDPELILPVLTDVVKVIRLVPQMQRFIEKVDHVVWSSPTSRSVTKNSLKTLLDSPQKLSSTLTQLEEWRALVETLVPMGKAMEDREYERPRQKERAQKSAHPVSSYESRRKG